MIDTVELFRIPQVPQRLISLQFLAFYLLGECRFLAKYCTNLVSWSHSGEKIQDGIHDSVEDARVALKLYRKWEELNKDGENRHFPMFEQMPSFLKYVSRYPRQRTQ